MTDEKLIEEAAKAISPWAWGNSLPMKTAQEEARRDARAAFAVFEKAHAPTDAQVDAACLAYAEGEMSYCDRGACCLGRGHAGWCKQ
jgi:hypothetical protein